MQNLVNFQFELANLIAELANIKKLMSQLPCSWPSISVTSPVDFEPIFEALRSLYCLLYSTTTNDITSTIAFVCVLAALDLLFPFSIHLSIFINIDDSYFLLM